MDISLCGKYSAFMQVWQSWVEIEHYTIAYFNCITGFEGCNTVFPLQVGLIHTTKTYEHFIHLHSTYEAHP